MSGGAQSRDLLRRRLNFAWYSGETGKPESREISKLCHHHGLTIEESVQDKGGYLPVNELTNIVLVIEDDQLRLAVSDEALRRGVPVKQVEA